MRYFRSFQFRLAVSASCWLTLAGCDTGAVGVESCRNIEYARCSAAAHCTSFGLKSEDSCKRFYRDHCLHGLPLSTDPGANAVNGCVRAINELGSCAAKSQDTLASDCGQNSSLEVCELLAIPEAIRECSFLGSSDAGASTGGAAATGGATGSGGTTDVGGAPSAGGASETGGTLGMGGAPSTGGLTSTAATEAIGGSVATL